MKENKFLNFMASKLGVAAMTVILEIVSLAIAMNVMKSDNDSGVGMMSKPFLFISLFALF